MFGHQQEENHDDNNAPVVNDVSAFAPADDNNADNSPAASPTVGAPATTDFGSEFIAADPAPESVAPSAPVDTAPAADNPVNGGAASDDLVAIKQSALQQLSPLVNHLDQAPEEKFRTTMMMIQASDDHSLIKAAYEAAGQITDEKARAQALLDVVNEINYFTQHNS